MDIELWHWAALLGAIAVILLLDLFVFHRGARDIPMREAAIWSAIWISLGLSFGGLLWAWQGSEPATQYLTGFLIEKSLSVDNVAVFALLFTAFAIPPQLQYRVLFWGVALAIVLRGIFILIGGELLDRFSWTVLVFGGLLVLTGIRMARHHAVEIHPEKNPALRLLRRVMPVSQAYDGERLLTRIDGRRAATPLLAALLLVATFDLVFAIDSVPAIFAITREELIVFAANAFALLGLRALYFLLRGSLDRFHLLQRALAVILVWVGAKMVVSAYWFKIDPWISLAVVGIVLAVGIVGSLLRPPRGGAPAGPEAGAPDGGDEIRKSPGTTAVPEREPVA